MANPFAPGGGPNCASQTRTRAHYYNPCSFANPLSGNEITTPVTDIPTAIRYLGGLSNQIYGPGYYGVNMSVFKNFTTFHEQYIQFRADGFNITNHPTLANPAIHDNTASGGLINGPKTFQNNTPDARFFQLSLRYAF